MNFLGKLITVLLLCFFSYSAMAFDDGFKGLFESVQKIGGDISNYNQAAYSVAKDLKDIRGRVSECGKDCSPSLVKNYHDLLTKYDLIRRTSSMIMIGSKALKREGVYNATPKFCSAPMGQWYSCEKSAKNIGLIPTKHCFSHYSNYVNNCRNSADLFVNGETVPHSNISSLSSYKRLLGFYDGPIDRLPRETISQFESMISIVGFDMADRVFHKVVDDFKKTSGYGFRYNLIKSGFFKKGVGAASSELLADEVKVKGVFETITPVTESSLYRAFSYFKDSSIFDKIVVDYARVSDADGRFLRCFYSDPSGESSNGIIELVYWYKSMPDVELSSDMMISPDRLITQSMESCPKPPVSKADIDKNSYVSILREQAIVLEKRMKHEAAVYAEQEAVRKAGSEWYYQHGYKLFASNKIRIEDKLSRKDKKMVAAGDYYPGSGVIHEQLGRLIREKAEYLKCQYRKGGTHFFLLSKMALDVKTQYHLSANSGISKQLDKCPEGSKDATEIFNDHRGSVLTAVRKIWDQEKLAKKRKPVKQGKPVERVANVKRDFLDLKRTYIPEVIFPKKALENGISYAVIDVQVLIDPSGTVKGFKLLSNTRGKLKYFRSAAKDIALRTRFEPVIDNGYRAWVTTDFSIEFGDVSAKKDSHIKQKKAVLFGEKKYGKIISIDAKVTASSTSKYDHENSPRALVGIEQPADYAFHTIWERNPWVDIDLGKEYRVTAVSILNRKKHMRRAAGLQLLASVDGTQWTKVWQAAEIKAIWSVDFTEPRPDVEEGMIRARYLRLRVDSNGNRFFHLRQVQVYGKDI